MLKVLESPGISFCSFCMNPVNVTTLTIKTEVQMLNEILETVQKWQTIPQHISQQIKDLYDTVTSANMTGTTFPAVTVDLTRKIRPLFPHRAKHMKWKYGKKRQLTKYEK